MHYLNQKESEEALSFLKKAEDIAKYATCTRSRCGSVIVKDSQII